LREKETKKASMTTISDAFGVSNVFSLPIDHSSKDSTSDSSKRSRRVSLDVFDEVGAQAYEIYDEAINGDEGVLETYTKIWESFNVKDFNTSKMSKSPNLSHSSPFYPSRVPVFLASAVDCQ